MRPTIKILRFKFLVLITAAAVSDGFAADLTLVPDQGQVQPGQAVPLVVDIVANFNDEATLGGGMDITFDSAVLEFVSYTDQGIGDPNYQRAPDVSPGLLSSAAFGDFNGYGGNDSIAQITFNVRPDAPSGPSMINIGNSVGIAGPFVSAVTFVQQTVNFVAAEVTVLPACEYTVVSPNGGESWNLGSVHAIRWDSLGDDCGSDVRIELLDGGVLEATLAASTPNDGSFTWVVTGVPAGADYAIRVTDLTDPAFTDDSDAAFSLIDSPGFIFSSSYE